MNHRPLGMVTPTHHMVQALCLLGGMLAPARIVTAEPPFHVYAPSAEAARLWVIAARPSPAGIDLTVEARKDLGFAGRSIAFHPTKPLLYVAGGGPLDNVPAAAIALGPSGAVAGLRPFTMKHGTAYLATDRSGRFLLSADYGSGAVDVYALDGEGTPTRWVAGRDEGRTNAHAILPPPDNRHLYIPYVKDSNALLQYRFDAETGAIEPLDPADAAPPAGTGPRHIAYHPMLPVVYFSNEQHLGVSVYDRDAAGRLTFRRVCDAVPADEPRQGLSSSDIVITPDGRFLFAGIRGHGRRFDWITRYRIAGNGDVSLIGRTPADRIPWGFALSPQAEFLFVTSYEDATITAYRVAADGSLDRAAAIPCDRHIADIVAVPLKP